MLLGGGTWGTVELKSEKRGGWERKRRSSSFFYQNMASRGDFQAKGNYGPSQRPGPPLHITAAPARLGPGPGSGLVTWHWGPGPLGARALSPSCQRPWRHQGLPSRGQPLAGPGCESESRAALIRIGGAGVGGSHSPTVTVGSGCPVCAGGRTQVTVRGTRIKTRLGFAARGVSAGRPAEQAGAHSWQGPEGTHSLVWVARPPMPVNQCVPAGAPRRPIRRASDSELPPLRGP